MSNALMQNLAALLQSTNNSVVAAVSADKPIAKGSAFELIRLLNAKEFAGGEPLQNKNGEAVTFDDGSQITFGDLKFVEKVRPDGSAGNHYPLVWDLSQNEASAAIERLQGCPNKVRENSAKPNSRGGNKGQAKPANQISEADLVSLVTMIVQAQTGQPAKPVEAELAPSVPAGHRKVKRSEAAEVVSAKPKFTEGDVIEIDGVDWEITVYANGRPGFRKA